MGKQTGNGKACYVAAYWEMLVLIATFLTLGLMYAFLGTAEVIQAQQLQLLCAAAAFAVGCGFAAALTSRHKPNTHTRIH